MDNQLINQDSVHHATTDQCPKSPEANRDANNIGKDSPPIQCVALNRQLHSAVVAAESYDDLLKRLANLIADNSECLALWYSNSDENATLQPIIDEAESDLCSIESSTIHDLIASARREHEIAYCQTSASPAFQFVACPILVNEEVMGVLSGCFSTGQEAALRHHWLMTLIANATANWAQRRLVSQERTRANSLNDAMTLVASLDRTATIDSAGRIVVNHLRRLLGCDQVSFCNVEKPNTQLRLIAISDVEQIDPTTSTNQAVLSTCRSTISAKAPQVFPSESSENFTSELENYCRTSRLSSAVSMPLFDQNENMLGIVLVGSRTKKLARRECVEHLQVLVDLIAGHLAIVVKANEGIAYQVKRSLSETIRQNWAKKAAIVIGLTMLALMIPLPYNVSCDCQLEPVVRRFVAAPYDGILEQAFVQSGEIVTADQLLARMDGRSLRIELSGIQAELDAAKKRRDSALATGSVAKSHIARSEMKRHQSRIELLNRRLDNLEVKSPIDGIIVSGDLDKAQGAPLETGQTLFEVGPLDKMTAEIHIAESEIRFVEPGQPVRIKLNAYPFQTFSATVKHIHTRSEIVSDKNVFVAEVIMDNTAGQFKPGMAGTAKIQTGYSPVGWNVFHTAWERARHWMIW